MHPAQHQVDAAKKRALARVEGGARASRSDRPGRADGGGIHIKPSHAGRLHRDLQIPPGEPIPEARLAKAAHSPDKAVRKRAVFAENARHWEH